MHGIFKSNLAKKFDNSEKILLNSEFLKDIDAKTATYLGLGVSANYPHYPPSDVSTLSVKHSVKFLSKILGGAILNRFKRIFTLLPQDLSWRIKYELKKVVYKKRIKK